MSQGRKMPLRFEQMSPNVGSIVPPSALKAQLPPASVRSRSWRRNNDHRLFTSVRIYLLDTYMAHIMLVTGNTEQEEYRP